MVVLCLIASTCHAEWDEFRLDRLRDVKIDQLTLADGDILVYDGVLEYWKNSTSSAFGDSKWLRLDCSNDPLTNILESTDFKITAQSLGSPTYSTIKDFANSFGSAGRKTGGVISDATGGYIAVTAGTGFIKATDDDNAQLMFFDFPAPANIQIPSSSTRYIGVEYNTGTPRVVARTTYNWNMDTEFPLGRVINESINGTDELYIGNAPWWVTDGTTNIIQAIRSFGLIRRDASVGGLILSVTGTRNIAVNAGKVWAGMNDYDFAGIDTNVTGTVEGYWYKAGTGWQSSNLSQYSVTQWNDVTQTALQTIDNNKYCNVWIYGELNISTPSVAIIYPQAQYNTAAEAEATAAPTNLPTHISNLGILLGRIIIKQGVDAPVAVESAFGTEFTASVATNHANLSSLAWTSSGHTGTATRLAAFNGSGAAAEYTMSGTGTEIPTTASPTFTGTVTMPSDTNQPGARHRWHVSIVNPNAVVTASTVIPILALTDAALTITKIEVSTSSASYEIAGDLKFADARIGLANATVVETFDTTSGVRSDSSMSGDATIPSGKVVYLSFDSAPSASMTDCIFTIYWDYD
jgi:hypothetical protein